MRSRPPIPEGPYLIVGLARSGAAAARVLSERGARVIGVDAGAPPQARALVGEGTRQLAARGVEAQGIELHLHDGGLAYLDGVGAVIKSPGVPADAAVIAAAHARGIPVLGELDLAWRLLPNEFIAVTGTNGKTTTVELIGHIHREAGLPVAVAGNVGTALSGLVGKIEEPATVVCEASSFQLEDTLAFAPEAAVLLNITPDHIDRHGTLDAYRAAKLRIFANQRAGDVAALPVEMPGIELAHGVRRVRFGGDGGGVSAESHPASDRHSASDRRSASDRHPLVEGECVLRDGFLWWAGERLLEVEELRLRGEHNLQNAMAAAAVCLARGLGREAVAAGLRSFAGVPHRLQEVGSRDGVLYVNDSKATNVASTLVALRAFPRGGVHLILGGQGKGQDFTALWEAVAASCRAVYLIGEDAREIATALGGVEIPLREYGTLERAVGAASAAAIADETVLLSPACASFDQFTDYEERGTRFATLVQRIV